ncbi:MAG TPA: hypothetical protein VEL07_18295 [Planctomycetota bacterium]|nr:hypothetical protein [Planctomycetota bacterium]
MENIITAAVGIASRSLVLGTALVAVAAGRLAAAAEELPKIVRDQLEVVQPAIAKAQAEYARKVRDENAKLIVVIQKAMEKATKAGKLDDAVALRNALELAKSGELLQPFVEPTTSGLLGLEAAATDAGPAVITLSSGDPVGTLAPNQPAFANRDFLFSAVAKELMNLSYAQRSFKEPAPCTITVVSPGVLYVAVGAPSDGLDFAALGFTATDLKVKHAAGEQAIVRKTVRAGETITLAASATINSFPIWKGPADAK